MELEKYRPEWRYNRGGRTNEPPQLGLALSGGGMRSANFSFGVVHGLEKLGILTNVDAMSTVSGGGYAAAWYYFQTLYKGSNTESLFQQDDRYQKYLTYHGEIMSHQLASPPEYRWLEYGLTEVPLTLCFIPVNFVVNGIFGWHANVSPARRMYQNGPDRIFDVVPEKGGQRSGVTLLPLQTMAECAPLTDWSSLFFLNSPKHESFPALATNIIGKLPFPIVNTTAYIESSSDYSDHWLRNRVFEFTPLGYGSDYYGYCPTNFPVDYIMVISISAAAVDTASANVSRGATESWVNSGFDINWGYYIPNPNYHGSVFGKFWPLIYSETGHYQRDFDGSDIYLNDGANSDNLAAYSLIRRFCRSIIIVDAGYDPTYAFQDYLILRNALRNEKGVTLSIPDIDNCVLNSSYLKTNSWQHPVMCGQISYFPWSNTNDYNLTNNSIIKVTYIKLSLDMDKLDSYPGSIRDYYEKHKNDTMWDIPGQETSAFPHRTTKDLSYTPDEIQAYQDLGYLFVTQNAHKFNRFLPPN